MKILIIVAHPDDEVLGCGGIMVKHIRNGDEVSVCVVTKSWQPKWSLEYHNNKVEEQARVDSFLGVKKRYNLDFDTTGLNVYRHGEIVDGLVGVMGDVSPDVVYTHYWGDIHQDHRIVHSATMIAVRPPRTCEVLCYEVLSETELSRERFAPNVWVDVTADINKKVTAFNMYISEVRQEPSSRNSRGIRALAIKRGLEIHAAYAEAFMLVRSVR